MKAMDKRNLFIKNNLVVFLMIFISMFFLCGCGQNSESDKNNEVTIIYTNDVHTHIDNNKSYDDTNKENIDKLSYASVAALKKDLESEGKNVILVDAGDHSQGTVFGGKDNIKSIIDIMNATGYQVATLGNHEFDYGLSTVFENIKRANYPYLSCNFYSIKDKKLVLPAYKILDAGNSKVAFIGVSTPESLTQSNPMNFMDKDKKNYLYKFYAGDDGQELYSSVQKAIDEINNQADYIIGLGHLGVYVSAKPYRSEDVVKNTSGLDAFIDGHSHTTLEYSDIPDSKNNNVVLTQTGSELNSVGVMTLSKTGDKKLIKTKLINEYKNRDKTVEDLENKLINKVKTELNKKIASTDILLTTNDKNGKRAVRNQETNLADLSVDSFYYYFNEIMGMDCDIAINNSGCIRSPIKPGDITYMNTRTVLPFGNPTCMIEATGQQILDALEMGAKDIGVIDSKTNIQAENSGFLKLNGVAGMKYKVNSLIKSTVKVDDDGFWLASPTGKYKVYDIEIYNKKTNKYEPIDLTKIYHVAGINYVLRNQGDGMSMFKDCKLLGDYAEYDYEVLAKYFEAFKDKKISTENNPISPKYNGYDINYENLSGSGRIEIN